METGIHSSDQVSLIEFRRVRARIQPYTRITPLVQSEIPNVFLKLENLQQTHSFKIRGAFAYMLEFVAAGDKRRLLTVSAGNHGQAIARAASIFGLQCTVVVPANAPKTKIEAIEKYGIDLRIDGATYDEAEASTLLLAKETKKYAFASPYNDPAVILGQGSLAFEILEQLPESAVIVVPIGGGGLAAGVAMAMKQLQPAVRIIGVQAEASAAIHHGLQFGRLVKIPDQPSIADGIAGNVDLETITFPLIQKYVDDVLLVSENEIRTAMGHLMHREKLVVEGAAAAAFAVVLYQKVQTNGPVVVLITGGNVDKEAYGSDHLESSPTI
jgi:threonine dehydratase